MVAQEQPQGVRLQKVLAGAGVGSRRACEELITHGRVILDGSVVREQGVRVDPQTAVIHVDGVRVNVRADLVHLVLNKPRGVLSTMHDEQGRPCVGDWVADRSERLFHVGRLDADSEGLLLMTNDGELAHRLTHPSYEVRKTYLAQVPGPVKSDVIRQLKRGVVLDDGTIRVDELTVVDSSGGRALVEVVVHEGRKHLVRRLLAEVGHPVSSLVRTQIGPVRIGHQRQGTVRHLNRAELGELYRLVGL